MPDDTMKQLADGGRRSGAGIFRTLRGHAWVQILTRTVHEFSDDRIMAEAAAITYYSLLAIFPAIASLISIWGFFANPAVVRSDLANLDGIIPGGMMQVLGNEMKRVAGQGSSALSIGFFVGLAVSLWFASSGMKAVFDSLNIVYSQKEERGFFRLSGIALLFTLGWLVIFLIALGAVILLPVVLSNVGVSRLSGSIIPIFRWPGMLVIMMLGLAVLYHYGPSHRLPRLRWITWGNVMASLLWLGGSLLFTWYVANFGTYNRTYGSLGAAIGFMTWMWISAMVILLGAELDSEIQHQAEIDAAARQERRDGAS
ncbi:MAG: YihY/virulence factor BrkB family protein [Stellaceae bacterium]